MKRRGWTAIAALAVVGSSCQTGTDVRTRDADTVVETGGAIGGETGGEETPSTAVDCSLEALNGDDDEFVFTSAYEVVDGRFGAARQPLRHLWQPNRHRHTPLRCPRWEAPIPCLRWRANGPRNTVN